MGKELKVGETFYDGNDKLEVVEQDGCKGCYYYGGLYVCHKGHKHGNCYSGDREDKNNVVFKKIKNVQSKGSSLTGKTAAKLSSIFNKMINDMETKEVKIEIPEGMEIDKEKSDIEKGKIAFKKKEQEVKTWKDLIGINIPVGSSLIIEKGENPFSYLFFTSDDRSAFIDERHARSARAMAMISQLMPYYGGKITDKEWNNSQINKYTICRKEDYISFVNSSHYEFLAFHTKKQRDEFFYNNRQLVNDYLMID